MTVDVDVLVVGGGPVGLAAAIEARLEGMSVVIVEPRNGPLDKACGEALMPGAIDALLRIGVAPVGHTIAGFAYLNATRSVEHRFTGGQGVGVRRTALSDALMARAHEVGVQFRGGMVESVQQSSNFVTVGIRTPLSLMATIFLKATWVLACDGLHSHVRHLIGLERPSHQVRSGRRFGLRRHYRLAPWTDLVEVHWARSVEVYVTPVASDLVGVATLGAPGINFDREIGAISSLQKHLRGAEPVSALRGAGPLLQRTRRRVEGRVLLVGDSSGYVDALTGEGLRVGFAQAREAVAALVREDPQSYESAWASHTRDYRMLTSALVGLAASPFRSTIVPLASAMPWAFGAIIQRLAR
ncbi:NAD(P)/FAD-dependent oxidoreductase [Alpinimonas psychrophila]|uniref:Flavin-dependent dehydrogenase n=1 Tax=Alpinimonas psychrophila TaxID=748908 RepID=A0A7W3JT72_9MICO|nr:FAD-dependent monooxygenase [Alpinimonas psychrophila]MBA8828776.1 flavin-dependent dehydrogenase [Alpinimonas psychrophila]